MYYGNLNIRRKTYNFNDRGYALAYQKDGQRVVKVGINFSPETRNIDEWVSEE